MKVPFRGLLVSEWMRTAPGRRVGGLNLAAPRGRSDQVSGASGGFPPFHEGGNLQELVPSTSHVVGFGFFQAVEQVSFATQPL